MVTKQQQLEWLAANIPEWNSAFNFVIMSVMDVGVYAYPGDKVRHEITFNEWQQERDKMSSKPEVDNSWHERGEFPPVGCECEIKHENSEGWIKAKVVSITSEYAILVNQGNTGEYPVRLLKTKFRPMDYEKTLFVSGVIDMVACGLISHESAKELATSMFDAGYRKVKP